MRLIIEGCDGTGKSTLIEFLSDCYHCDIMRMTKNGSKEFNDYIDKHKLDNVIFDRCFISEHVYCSLFGKKPSFSEEELGYLINNAKERGFKFIILRSDAETIRKRLIKRGNEYGEVLDNIDFILKRYEEISEIYDIPMIDSSDNQYSTFADVITILEGIKK